jgi:hypothetical protein
LDTAPNHDDKKEANKENRRLSNLVKDLVGGNNQHQNYMEYPINQHESNDTPEMPDEQINSPTNEYNNIGQDTDQNEEENDGSNDEK